LRVIMGHVAFTFSRGLRGRPKAMEGIGMSESVVAKLAAALKGNGRALCAWTSMYEPAIAELLAREDFDAAVRDRQHGALDFPGAAAATLVGARAGRGVCGRVPVGDLVLASRPPDAGAAGIIAPMINGGGEAGRFVEFPKFPPLGERSWGPRAALALS